MNKINFLGSSWSYMAVLFDICYETYGTRSFSIYKNIPVEGEPGLRSNPLGFEFAIHGPGDFSGLREQKLIFGVTGPWGKYSVFNYFNRTLNITEEMYHSLIHPQATIAPSAEIAAGFLAEPSVVVSSQTRIGFAVSIKRSVSVGHHVALNDYSEINPGVVISSHVSVGKGSIIGSGAVIKDGVSIGDNTIIGMGSVVTKDIPAGVVAFGNPCRVNRDNNKERFL